MSLQNQNSSRTLRDLISEPITVLVGLYFAKGKLSQQSELKKKNQIERYSIFEKKELSKRVNYSSVQKSSPTKQIKAMDIQNKAYKICITGGPCAGKTSGLSYLTEKLKYDGYQVFIVPEAATLIAQGGGMIDMSSYTEQQGIDFQINLMQTQIQLEDTFINIAMLTDKQSVVICDRGLMDGSIYIDGRYDAVFHLVTTADGAEQAYSQNNEVRHESPRQAIILDRKLQLAWLYHPNFDIIDNHSINTFEEKLERLLYKVRRCLGIGGAQKHFYKRYLLDTGSNVSPKFPKDITYQEFFIEDHFIFYETFNSGTNTIGKFTKVRRRGTKNGEYIYILSMSKIDKGKQSITLKKTMSYKEYLMFLSKQDEQRQSLMKHRKIFMYENFQFIVDSYLHVKGGFSILRVKLEERNQEHSIPSFLKVIRDVTDEQGYKSKYLSKKNWYIPQEDKKALNVKKESFQQEELEQ